MRISSRTVCVALVSVMVLPLPALAQTDPASARVTGRVIDAATGSPATGAEITLSMMVEPQTSRDRASFVPPPRGVTDSDGAFTPRACAPAAIG